MRAHHDADADLPRALAHRERDDAVQPQRREQQRQRATLPANAATRNVSRYFRSSACAEVAWAAVVLASLGLYAVIAYVVRMRAREFSA